MFFDAAVYSAEALRLAAAVFASSGRAASAVGIRLKKARGGAAAAAPPAAGPAGRELLAAFGNEALNQQCRLDLAGKNSRIAGIIVTKTLLSALGQPGDIQGSKPEVRSPKLAV